MLMRTGAIYTLYYQRWQTNLKIYAFILFPGGGMTKTHLLNLGANQLTIIERARIVRTIVRLAQIPNSSKYNGRLLYKILKAYLPNEIKKCYRTFFTNYIQKAALLNYGLNNADEFTDLELSGQAKDLYDKAQRDFQIKALNLYSKRGYNMNAIKDSLVGDIPKPEDTTQSGASGIKSATTDAIRPATTTESVDESNNDENDTPDDGDEFGY